MGQALINALDQVTAEGFVFRVDMRLRPYGESGALVHNFDALEEYYQDQGRDWERYALIKARPVTGDPERAHELMAALRPFVFRRYVDFGVIESLRGMKQMISTEVRRRGLQDNVKLGHGGIREVEFIAQCFQLIRGGRDLGLQQRELLQVLQECVVLGCLPARWWQNCAPLICSCATANTAYRATRTSRRRSCPRTHCRNWPWPQ